MRVRARGQAIKRPEQDLQILVADHLRIAIQSPARFWFAPNGGNLSKVQRGKFQRMGLTPGVADLHFIWPRFKPIEGPEVTASEWTGGYGVIELKASTGKLSDHQTEFLSDVAKCGHPWAVCKSLEQVVSTLREWGVPMREIR